MGVCLPSFLPEALNFAQDIPRWGRHNSFMRRLSMLGLFAVISCQVTTIEDGDSMFRRGNYPQALEIYTHLASEEPSGELQARMERTSYFLLEQGVRNLLHLERPEDALEVLDSIENSAPADREEVVAALRLRTFIQIGRGHFNLGFDFYEATDVDAAAREYTLCLSWDPQNTEAKINLAQCEEWIATRQRLGDNYYFEGMDSLRSDQDLRARTAFMHAGSLLGDDSRAAERLRNLTASLADDSREKSVLFMNAGLTGQAWAYAQDAFYLAPQDERNLQLTEQLANVVLGNAYILEADVAQRGGIISAAEEYLEKTRALGVAEHGPRIAEVAELTQERRNSDRYSRARAYELDSQMVHARDIYAEILVDEAGFPWRDVEQRLAAIRARLAEAKSVMNAGIAAHQAGDDSTYATRLQEVLRMSVDYPGALLAYRVLLSEQQ